MQPTCAAAIVAITVARLGKTGLWKVVRVLREAQPSTAETIREGLRRMDVYLPDGLFTALCETYGEAEVKVDTLVEDLLHTMNPRRRHVVDLALQALDPEKTGWVSYEALDREYDTLRHPSVTSFILTPEQARAAFFESLEVQGTEGALPAEELLAYYAGISSQTPEDTQFELLCIRSFSLDRPRLSFEDEAQRLYGSSRVFRQNLALGESRSNPLYTTTNSTYGKTVAEASTVPSKYGRSQKFTRNLPPQSGGATSMNM